MKDLMNFLGFFLGRDTEYRSLRLIFAHLCLSENETLLYLCNTHKNQQER